MNPHEHHYYEDGKHAGQHACRRHADDLDAQRAVLAGLSSGPAGGVYRRLTGELLVAASVILKSHAINAGLVCHNSKIGLK